LQVALAVRAAAWAEDEPVCGHAQALIEAVLARDPQPLPALVAQWQDLARDGGGVALLCSVLGQHLDPVYQKGRAERAVRQHALPRLHVDSLSTAMLADAVRPWVPAPIGGPTT
jgi:hypothetical protein